VPSPLADAEEFLAKVVHLLQMENRSFEAALLARAKIRIEQTGWDNWNNGTEIYTIYIDVPSPIYAELGQKTESVERAILKKAQFLLRAHDQEAVGSVVLSPDIPYDTNWREKVHSIPTPEVLRDLEEQLALMIHVATGGRRIQEVNTTYRERRSRIRTALNERGIKDQNPYDDLWAWYRKWSSDLPTYQSRREYLSALLQPLIEQVRSPASARGAVIFDEPTGWAKVDKLLGDARRTLERATEEIDYQKVGLICREALIAVAQVVFDPLLHPSADGTGISNTDAKRMLEAYLSIELAGGSDEAARRHAKAALAFANELVHRPTAQFRDAALCAEATASVVNIIAITSGQRNP